MQATRIIEFDTAHRIIGHSKCSTLHGHRYKAEFTAEGSINEMGMVIDFGVIKSVIGGWIDEHFDHTSIICEQDTETLAALNSIPQTKPVYVVDFNTTAENIAKYLLTVICPRLLEGSGVQVVMIQLWETPNCYVVAT